MKKQILTIALILLMASFMFAEVEVIVEKANVRVKPDINSEVLTTFTQGTKLKDVGMVDDWFAVLIQYENVKTFYPAYIHKSIVKYRKSENNVFYVTRRNFLGDNEEFIEEVINVVMEFKQFVRGVLFVTDSGKIKEARIVFYD